MTDRPFIGLPNLRNLTCNQIELEVHDSELPAYEKAYFESEVVTLPSGTYRVVGASKIYKRSNCTQVYLTKY